MKKLVFLILGLCFFSSTTMAAEQWDYASFVYEVMPNHMKQAYIVGMINGYQAGLQRGYLIRDNEEKKGLDGYFESQKKILDEGFILPEKLKILMDWCDIEGNAPSVSEESILSVSNERVDITTAKKRLLDFQSNIEMNRKELRKKSQFP